MSRQKRAWSTGQHTNNPPAKKPKIYSPKNVETGVNCCVILFILLILIIGCNI